MNQLNIIESFKVAMASIVSNKLRSFLTMLGIIIGISSVITIVSIGKGGQSAITGEFQKIGVNVLEVKVNNDEQISQSDYFTLQDVKNIVDRVPDVLKAVPIYQMMGIAKSTNSTKNAVIVGSNEDYPSLTSLDIEYGRFFNKRDVDAKRNVIVIDDMSAKQIFGYTDCTGKTLKIGTKNSTVSAVIVGVYKNVSGALMSSLAKKMPVYVYAPITFIQKLNVDQFNISQVEALTKDSKNNDIVSSEMIRVLERTHHNKDKYKAENVMVQIDQVNKILNIFTTIIGAIAAISLLVGGIGVMNIMLVSVTERTREIGIRKAIGARRKDIMVQFLIESVIISLIGGIIGMVLGVLVAYGIGSFLSITPSVSISTILVAVGFSSAVGIFFGIYPANKASKLNPIDALRYE